MKRAVAWMLTMVLLAAGLPALAEAAPAFTLVSTGVIEDVNAESRLYEHTKTKAQVLFILNDDPNRGFSIGFATEPTDDTGVLHILEHASCASSEKYPSRDVFFDAESQTYLTYINAFTSQRSTAYLTSSMSEDQLYTLTDMYLDCCFHSSIRTDPNFFYREGWRYEMADADAALTINGIVYNEMQGVYSDPTSVAYRGASAALFPDTYQGYDAGGLPSVIPTLSYEECVAFYDACYHPSNSLSVFYGDVDVERFLALLDEGYFSHYDYQDPGPASPMQAPFEAPAVVEIPFPVAQDAEDLASTLVYAWAFEETGFDLNCELSVIASLIGDDSSDMMRALHASGIAGDYMFMPTYVGQQLVFMCFALDADGEQAEAFSEIVKDALADVVSNGFDQALLDSQFAAIRFQLALTRNAPDVAIGVLERIGAALDTEDLAWFDPYTAYTALEARAVPGYLEAVIEAQMLNNPHAALVSVVPVPGLLEQHSADLAAQLADKKAAMTDEELEALVAECAAFAAWNELPSNADTIAKLKAVSAETLPVEIPQYAIETKAIDGALLTTAQVDGTDVSYTQMLFDISHLPLNVLHDLKLYAGILGNETQARTAGEVSTLLLELLNSLNVSVSVQEHRDTNTYTPVLSVSFFALNDDYGEAVRFVSELLRETWLEKNADKLAQSIAQEENGYQFPESALASLEEYMRGHQNEASRFVSAVNGMGYYQSLPEFEAMLETKPEALFDRLDTARTKALGGALTVRWAGDATAIDPTGALEALTGLLTPVDEEPIPFDLDVPARRTGVAMNVTGCYVHVAASLHGHEDVAQNAALLVATELLRNEYFLPEIRFKGGAYGGYIAASPQSWLTMQSYRDVDFVRTLGIMENSGAYLRGLAIDEDMLENYKLSALSRLTALSGDLNMAMGQMGRLASGLPADMNARYAEAVKAVTIDEVKAMADVIDTLWAEGGYYVVASAEAIGANESLFDEVIKLP